MVLIGRRHWQARKGEFLFGHYLIRFLAVALIGAGVTGIIQNRSWLRADVSTEQLSALSTETKDLLKELRDRKDVTAIKIDAYVSPTIPADYSETKLNLLSTLEEFRALGGSKVSVEKHEIRAFWSRGRPGRKELRHYAPRIALGRRLRRVRRGFFPRHGRHFRVGQGGDAVHRQGHPGGI